MGAQGETKKTNAGFLRYCLKRCWMAEGASEEHADIVADAILTGIRQGVFEVHNTANGVPTEEGTLRATQYFNRLHVDKVLQGS